jgi:hypothetical protein
VRIDDGRCCGFSAVSQSVVRPAPRASFDDTTKFERLRLSVEAEKFVPKTTKPFGIGFERREFDRKKLERLIATAWCCDAATVRHRLEIYSHKLKRFDAAKQRFKKLRAEMIAHKDIARLRPAKLVHIENSSSPTTDSRCGLLGVEVLNHGRIQVAR